MNSKTTKTTTKKVASSTVKATKGLMVDIYNLNGEVVGQYTLPKEVFEVKANTKLITQSIKVFLANQRKSHAKVKDRGEVSGTTKKMWAQKGTGRARHGSAKAPIFVGGGSAHGPQGNQNWKLTMPARQRKVALNSLLSLFATNKSILVVDDFSKLAPKTKEAFNFVGKLEKQNELLAKSKKIGIISSKSLPNVKRAFGNIPGLNVLNLDSLNTYILSNQNFLIFSKDALEGMEVNK